MEKILDNLNLVIFQNRELIDQNEELISQNSELIKRINHLENEFDIQNDDTDNVNNFKIKRKYL